MPTVDDLFHLAVQHHQAGNILQAEQLYRQVLQANPRHADALHLLGVLALDNGQIDHAVTLIRQAVELNQTNAIFRFNLGLALEGFGRLDDAIRSCEQALALQPDFPEAHLSLGNIQLQRGNLAEAENHYCKAVSLRPDFAGAHKNLGNVYREQRRFQEAEACFRRALSIDPGDIQAHNNLGLALADQDRFHEAIASYRQALEINPGYADAQKSMGLTFLKVGKLQMKCGKFTEAIELFRLSIRLIPDCVEAHHNLGCALQELGNLEEAVACFKHAVQLQPNGLAEVHNSLAMAMFEQGQCTAAMAALQWALKIKPDYANAHHNMGLLFVHEKKMDDAITCYQRAIAVDPTHAGATCALAMAYLAKGDFQRGWPAFESRFLRWPQLKRNFSQPQWTGSDCTGRTLLLHTEGGFGDALHFVRYVPLVAAGRARVVLECQPELKSLFEQIPGVAAVVSRGEPLPHFDLQCPLQSLPLAMGTTFDTIPANVPYLAPDPRLVQHWQSKLEDSAAMKVGLVWAGSEPKGDLRSRSLALFAPLVAAGNVVFFSLQKGEQSRQAATPPCGMILVDWTAELHDFSATAALVANLDLVISVDTSVAHLAGALGKPVWTLIPYYSDFRWLLDGDTTPWYPTMRLFRQRHRSCWDDVVEKLASELSAAVKSSAEKGTA